MIENSVGSEILSIAKSDKEYPELLRKIKNSPEELYIRGQIFPGQICVAIVGARRCSAYGRQMSFELAFGLARAGVVVVSGFAPGIDTAAHQGALEAGGRTIAVLGTGLDKKSIYPQSNVRLADRIVEQGGALLSEYPAGTHGSKITFPKRNRIIAGLSLGVAVVEGREKSGSLITANYALQEKRKLFAVPGQIGNQLAKAPNLLLKKGALLVENAQDILKELGLDPAPKFTEAGPIREPGDFRPGLKFPLGRASQLGLGPASKFPEAGPIREPGVNLILEVLSQENPLHIDGIIEKTGLPAQKVIALLSSLELEGQVRNFGGKMYGLISA